MAHDVAPREIVPAVRLRGTIRLPGDKSVSHRALMLAAIARGESTILAAGDGADIRSTAGIAVALGAQVERSARADGNVDYRIVSPGADGLHEPSRALDCGNSGTSLRLFAGILAGLPMTATLDGDESLRERPVARIIEPLRSMGAVLHARDDDSRPPLTVVGRTPLRGIEHISRVPSAQVKSAVLLAGLRAEGRTSVSEPVATRDHTERMLRGRGVAVRREVGANGWVRVELDGGLDVQAIEERVPGDVSAAAFWLVAAAIHPDAELTITDVGLNPTRRAIVDVLRAMGARIEGGAADGRTAAGPATDALDDGVGEPIGDLVVRSSELRAIELGPAEVAAAIDEIPILCLAATQARGTTRFRGAGELRHKESDRIAGIAAGLSALGARVTVEGDDIAIAGPGPLRGAFTDSHHDHRLAMTFAVAGLIGAGRTTIAGSGSVSISYPSFFADLERIRS